MSGKLWLVARAVLAVVVVYFILIVAIAGTGQMQLVAAVHHWPELLSAVLVLGCPLLIATGLFPALALHALHIRSLLAYIANAIVAAAFGFYAFYFNFCVADGLGGMLIHVPKGDAAGVDWTYAVPPFAQMLRSVFFVFVSNWPIATMYFQIVAVCALVIALLSGLLFWRLVIRRAAKRENAAEA